MSDHGTPRTPSRRRQGAPKGRPASRRPSGSRRRMGGPGRGPMGGGMVGQKAMTFGPSAKRLVAPDAPGRGKAHRRRRCSASSASS